MTKKKIIIATGGTGGHIFPAYSLASYLMKKDFNVKLTTDKRGEEYLKNYKNLNLIKIPSSPLIRKNILKLTYSISTNFFSILKSLFFLSFNRPCLVFGVGGYSSFPVCVAAFILRIKFVIYESNLTLGKANKYLLPFAKKVFVSYRELEGIPEKYNDKVVETGNLIREEIINLNLQDQENSFNTIKILVLGGSQSAKVFADELPQIFKKVKNSGTTIKVLQQCQKNQVDQLSQFYKKAGIEFEIFNFTDKIINYYSQASLVITRSGASVLAELVNINKPFIAVPLPTSADNHQYKNAEFYQKKGYGYLLEEKDIKDKLYELLNLILKDKLLIQKILSNQKQYSDKNIFKNLSAQLEEILDEKN
mgnify:CR=1 FL=1